MAIEPKTTREHIVSLYGHISGVKKNLLGSFSCGGDRSHTFIRKIYNLNPIF